LSDNRSHDLADIPVQPQYRLRVGEVRVFYDVTREAVEVLAIVTKAEAAGWLAEHGTPGAPGGAG